MPELYFAIRWPDGTTETCYSPSTIIRDHFSAGETYPLPEFLTRSRAALTAASNRVRTQHGHACSLAEAQLARIEDTATRYPETSQVLFESFRE